jgi:type IV secretory pathway VirB4 component
MFGFNKKDKKQDNTEQASTLKTGSVSVVDIIAPSSVEVDFKHIRVSERFYRTFFVVDYPRFVSPNWLSTLIDLRESMNISMFIYPTEASHILENLKRKIAEMEATIESDVEAGLEPDPKIQAALEDAIALQQEMVRGVEKFFLFGLYITLSAQSLAELDEKSKVLVSLLSGIGLLIKPATLQMEEGFKTTLPTGIDDLYVTRNMDTTSLATTFPFTSYEISHPNGVLYGINTLNNSLVIIDRFSLENANEVVFGKSGSGKSFLVKLEILRQMMFDAEILIIDPEEEYKRLTEELGGAYISFSPDSSVKINPFSLNLADTSETQLGTKILSLHSLLKIMLGEMTPVEEAFLDRALVLTYKQKGITPDPKTHNNEPPLLEDLYNTLLSMGESQAKDLAFRLEKYVKEGGFSGLFSGQTNYDIKERLTVFSLKALEDALRSVGMHMVLDFIWNRVRTSLRKRILVVDEAWYLMKYPDSAAFLQGIVKRARKYFLGVTTITQDIEDFLGSDYGKTIVSNSSIQILMKQGAGETETISKTFLLSEGEKQFLQSTQTGVGLLFAGQNHITVQFAASEFEYNLITSRPQDILRQSLPQNPQKTG